MKKTITYSIQETGLIPVFYNSDIGKCKEIVSTSYRGGIRAIEFLDRGEAAIDIFPELKRHIQESCTGMFLGIGSIIGKNQAEKYIDLGADFIVSPILDERIASICTKSDIYWIPGCSTPSEIARAKNLGADIIKVFPGEVLGPGFIKAVLAPMPGLKLMPTGGVEPTEENLRSWFEAGAFCVGLGSKLYARELIADPSILEEKIRNTIEIIQKINHQDG